MKKALDMPDGDYFRQHLRFDEETGLLFWISRPLFDHLPLNDIRNNTRRSLAGKRAGVIAHRPNGRDYFAINIEYRKYLAHRIVMAMHLGSLSRDYDVDHIDGDGLNNRLGNLRLVDRSINLRNRVMQSNNSSGHVGVYWIERLKKWNAKGKVNGKNYHLGVYSDKNDAIQARKEWQEKVGGFTDRHGLPSER